LTPAQKQAQAKQKAKLEALLASGVIVQGLQEQDEPTKKKKVVYSNKKKKRNFQLESKEKDNSSLPSVDGSSEAEIAVRMASKNNWEDEDLVKESIPKDDESKDSWEDEANVDKVEGKDSVGEDSEEENIKDSWDADSEEENVKDSWDADSEPDEKSIATKKVENKLTAIKEPKPATAPPSKTVTTASQSPQSKIAPDVKHPTSATVASAPKRVSEILKEDEEGSEECSDDDSDQDSESDQELTVAEKLALKKKEESRKRREERIAASLANRTKDNLRSPICCILGHVDTGKTKLLDKIRQTNVQEGEAGGITQQIGATYFPVAAVEEKTKMIHKGNPSGYKLPGLLVIDTPGHESFTNLRSRGSSLCNIAVLVVDIVHGLEPQTIESINLLKMRKTPFVVALNKIDRLFDWKANPNYPTRETLALQKATVISEFNDRVQKTIVAFAEQGLNACLYWDNKNMGKYVSLIPTSAITGEGVPDLLHLLVELTQSRMTDKLMYLSELECTVLEVKVIEGLGTTIDVVLSNGVLHEGDRICVCGLNGPIVTTVRALLTPQPLRELRVKSQYQHHKSVKAALGIKIAAPDLEKAIAGSKLLVIGPDDDEEDVMEEVMGDLTSLLSSIDKSGKGVCVQASTLGSLEALLTFLKQMNIPVSGINIGPVHKKDIMRASVMLERAPIYAQLLAFDVPVDKDAELFAKESGVTIFTANIIYHLFDKFTAHMKHLEEQKQKDALPSAIFPCILKMVRDAVFNKRAPIIIGVDVVEGVLKIGTPLSVINEVIYS
jgi:translation initiation factor 5B